MRDFIKATFVLAASLAVTLLILGAIFARHPLGASALTLEYPVVEPAVFVDGTHSRPGRIGDAQMRSGTDDGSEVEQCPYLEAVAAATACPVAPETTTARACPYLPERHRNFADAHSDPVEVASKNI